MCFWLHVFWMMASAEDLCSYLWNCCKINSIVNGWTCFVIMQFVHLCGTIMFRSAMRMRHILSWCFAFFGGCSLCLLFCLFQVWIPLWVFIPHWCTHMLKFCESCAQNDGRICMLLFSVLRNMFLKNFSCILFIGIIFVVVGVWIFWFICRCVAVWFVALYALISSMLCQCCINRYYCNHWRWPEPELSGFCFSGYMLIWQENYFTFALKIIIWRGKFLFVFMLCISECILV